MGLTVNRNESLPSANGNGNGHKPAIEKKPPVGRMRPQATLTKYAHVTGWGMQVPARIMPNSELEAVVDTTDEWIRSRTGIQQRRIASERESVVSLGFEAAREALARADVHPADIDLIVVATSTPEDIYPSSACKIQNLLGAIKAGAFDLSAACSGFVYALNVAAQSIRSGSIETALVIGSEVNSRILDWNDRATCILFGDGAGAIVLQARTDAGGLLSCILGSDGSGADLLGIPTIGTAVLADDRIMHKLHMDGREVFRFATHVITDSVRAALDQAGLSMADVALIVPHQANQRILSAAARSLNVPERLFYSNVERYGNTSAASIPMALYEAEKEGRIKPNDNIIIVGFGGGLTWGAAVIQWGVVPQPAERGVVHVFSQGRREAAYILAYWRGLFMKIYRRIEVMLVGTPAPRGHLRRETQPTIATRLAEKASVALVPEKTPEKQDDKAR
ncbi:MAG TPA: beta-ketoacyl-ACP synthase III [Aggregatilineales bacterium]|nr:beta-ketoacyl-ACP synthase III [Aggregatilineales bacterium]